MAWDPATAWGQSISHTLSFSGGHLDLVVIVGFAVGGVAVVVKLSVVRQFFLLIAIKSAHSTGPGTVA